MLIRFEVPRKLKSWIKRTIRKKTISCKTLAFIYGFLYRNYLFYNALLSSPFYFIKFIKTITWDTEEAKGLYLQTFGPQFLEETIQICENSGITPFLVFGTLLGFHREKGFIKHDGDIDLGLFKRDFLKVESLKKSMKAKGYLVKIQNKYEILFFKRGFPSLFIHFCFFYKKKGRMLCSMTSEDHKELFTHYFPWEVFAEFKKITFLEQIKVLIPAQVERFLTITYGDWRTPKKEWDFLYDPLNIRIEENIARCDSMPRG